MKFVKHFLFSLGLTLASVDYVFEDHRGEEHTLKHLTVTGYKYISINSEILKNFINLEQISIRGTSIRVLPEGLKNLKKLKRFEFRNNNAAIELLNFDILKDLPDLRKIEIACNRRDLTGCKETESGEKVGTPFPISVCNCMQITHLLVNHNSIFEIPNEIVNLKNLFELDLSDNQIESINPRLLELTDLSKLFLGNNLVTVFPSFLLIMKNLKFLNLENNLIGYNDPMILNFKTVHNGLSLILRNNLILKNSIDTNLGLDRLKELNLKDIDLSLQSDFKDVVTENCKKDPHWNLFELSKIDLSEDMKILENTISDRSFKRMWIEVIRHLIFDDCNDNGEDWTSNDKGVLLYNTDKLIDKTTKSRIFKIIKSMKKDVTEIDKIDFNTSNPQIKTYTTLIFFKIMKSILKLSESTDYRAVLEGIEHIKDTVSDVVNCHIKINTSVGKLFETSCTDLLTVQLLRSSNSEESIIKLLHFHYTSFDQDIFEVMTIRNFKTMNSIYTRILSLFMLYDDGLDYIKDLIRTNIALFRERNLVLAYNSVMNSLKKDNSIKFKIFERFLECSNMFNDFSKASAEIAFEDIQQENTTILVKFLDHLSIDDVVSKLLLLINADQRLINMMHIYLKSIIFPKEKKMQRALQELKASRAILELVYGDYNEKSEDPKFLAYSGLSRILLEMKLIES